MSNRTRLSAVTTATPTRETNRSWFQRVEVFGHARALRRIQIRDLATNLIHGVLAQVGVEQLHRLVLALVAVQGHGRFEIGELLAYQVIDVFDTIALRGILDRQFPQLADLRQQHRYGLP